MRGEAIGLFGQLGSNNELEGGVFVARDGLMTVGIKNAGTLQAYEVTARAVESDQLSSALYCSGTCDVWGGTFHARNSGSIVTGVYVEDARFTGRDFIAVGEGNGATYGLHVRPMLPAPPQNVKIQQAVLDGLTNSVYVMNFFPPQSVDIANTRLIGGPVLIFPIPPGPVVMCTLTSRDGNPNPTLVTGACP